MSILQAQRFLRAVVNVAPGQIINPCSYEKTFTIPDHCNLHGCAPARAGAGQLAGSFPSRCAGSASDIMVRHRRD